jgi:tetratricopeptide (TPR) repeat protein
VQKKKPRWGMIAVLGFSSLMFLGISIFPLIGGLLTQQKEKENAAISTAQPSATGAESAEMLLKEEEGYQIVLKRDPQSSTVLQGLVETRLKLIQQGVRKPKDVVEPLEKLAKLNPSDLRYSIALAQAQEQSGNSAAAAAAYRAVLDQQPTNRESLQGYVTILLKQNQSAAAFDLLQKSIATAKQINQQQPNSADLPAIEIMLGDVYMAQQKAGEAIALYDRLNKENPTDFRPIAAKGLVLRSQGKNAEAVALFQSAQVLAPEPFKEKIQQLITVTQAPATAPVSPALPSPQSSAP